MRKFIVPLLALAACGGEEQPADAPAKKSAPPPPAAWKMAEGAETAYSVADAKEELPAEEIVVVGRIQKMVKGYAQFLLTDDKLAYCGEVNKDDTCPTPWDYCCDPPDEVRALTLSVQFDGEGGMPAEADLSGDLRHCDLVEVRGTVKKDEHGNVTVHAKQYRRKERPELPDYVRFP